MSQYLETILPGLCTDTQWENFENEAKSIVLKILLHQSIHVKCVMQTSNTLFCQAISYMLAFSFLIFQSRIRFPPEAPWMCHVWLCFPSLSSSWSPWGFGTCNRGRQPCLWEFLLTRRLFWAGQVCGVSVTPPEHQELRTDQALGVYVLHSDVPQNQGQQNSGVASLLLHLFIGVQF